jgi:hypothetical protein
MSQHDIKVSYKSKNEVTDTIEETISEKINEELLNFNDSGTIEIDGVEYNWEIDFPMTYLDEKVKELETKGEVVFNQGNMVYQIHKNSDNMYEINQYDFSEFIPGEELDIKDGGICSGSAIDAIYFMLGN